MRSQKVLFEAFAAKKSKGGTAYMKDRSRQIWQIAAGEAGRFYSDLFLQHDVMFLGPGDIGEYSKEAYTKAIADGWAGSGIVSDIASFHSNVREGDFVLMRNGLQVKSVGVVAGPYAWSSAFDDVYGWSLQHMRRVIWQEHLDNDLERLQINGPLFKSRKQMHTFTRCNDSSVLNPIEPLLDLIRKRDLRALPLPLPDPLSLDEVGQELFARGIANDSVEKLLAAIARQRRLLHWYSHFGIASGRPTEHEVVAHTVLPLLMALGWSEQLLAIEWKRVDLAVFRTTPSTSSNCVLICEAKIRNHGLQDVRKQAFRYVSGLGLSDCRKVLVTDGGRFYLYQRPVGQDEWNDQAVGYLNIEKIRTNHLAPPNTNAIDTIVALTPAAAGRPIQ